MKFLVVVVVAAAFSGCAFKHEGGEQASGNAQLDVARPLEAPSSAVTVFFSEDNTETRALRFSSGAARIQTPIVVPLPTPTAVKVRLRIPPIRGFDLRSTVTASLDGQTIRLRSKLIEQEVIESGLTAEIELPEFGVALNLRHDQNFVFRVAIYSTADQAVVDLPLRTVPGPIAVRAFAPRDLDHVRVGPEETATVLRQYEIENQGADSLVTTLPYQVEGRVIEQFELTRSAQTARCAAVTETSRASIIAPGRLLLVPLDAALPDLRRLLADTRDPAFSLELAPRAPARLALILMTDREHNQLKRLGVCWTGQQRHLHFGCHQTSCGSSHWEKYDCVVREPKECRRCSPLVVLEESCKTREVCDQWNIDQNAPVTVRDHNDIVGTGFEITDPFAGAGVRFADIPHEASKQSGKFELAESRGVIAGQVDFSVGISRDPIRCEQVGAGGAK